MLTKTSIFRDYLQKLKIFRETDKYKKAMRRSFMVPSLFFIPLALFAVLYYFFQPSLGIKRLLVLLIVFIFVAIVLCILSIFFIHLVPLTYSVDSIINLRDRKKQGQGFES